MPNSVQNINKVNAGTCPHGLAPGACPICSKMGGGGGRAGERPQKPGEMSYHQCAMIGAMMRAREHRIEAHEQNLEKHLKALKNFESTMAKLSENMIEFAERISNNILLKPAALIIKNIGVPIVNFIRNLPLIAANISERFIEIKEKLASITDKLTAIFGEAKAFIEKKVSELISTVKSKFDGLFKILKRNNTDDEDTKIDDDKRIFNLKTILHKLRRKKKKDERSTEDR